jgi:hypothetical protein
LDLGVFLLGLVLND